MAHSDIAPLAFLVGTWTGRGDGRYPTIEPFAYTEQIEITAMPTPVLRYTQRTADAETGQPRHAEAGWFRLPAGVPELVIAQPTGIAEVHQGVLDGQALTLTATEVTATPSAAGHRVGEVVRRIGVDGDVMRYELHMAAVGQALQLHLRAELRRS